MQETFDGITRKTRTHFEPTKARAVLFEGPPGTGKTLSARIVAGRYSSVLFRLDFGGFDFFS